MCGILGLIAEEEISGEDFSNALDELKSRGPDDEGYRCLEEQQSFSGEESIGELPPVSDQSSRKWLGNRRLAITGSSDCRLPMSYKNLSIVYEGEIYNYKNVREKLENLGHEFKTDGDTEIFLHAYQEWGIEAVKRFEGKWSAGIYDSSKDQLVCLRDHFGTKPLYYINGERFAFSSNIKPLIKLKKSSVEENTSIKIDYLKYGITDHTNQTFFQNVKQLRPGEYLIFDGENVEIEELPSKNETTTVKKAVKNSVRSKVPESEWCITLSGGLDSSIVSGLLSDEISESFSANIADEKYEDSKYRQDVIQKTGIENEEIDITLEELVSKIPESIEIQEEPTNMLPAQVQQILFEKISKTDNKVVLTGSGADELFFGYPQFVPEAAAESFRKKGFKSGLKLIYSHLHRFNLSMLAYLIKLLLPIHTEAGKLQKNSKYFQKPRDYSDQNIKTDPRSLSESRIQQLEYSWYQSILRFTDKNAGAVGLETREGFLSQELRKTAENQLDLENFQDGYTKKILRDSFQDILPKSVVERKDKVGFMPTDNSSYNPEIKKKFLEVFKSESFRARRNVNQSRIVRDLRKGQLDFHIAYRYYCYEIWCRKFID